MIDEARTLEIFGYMSEELAPKSMKRIAVLCEECGRIWTLRKQDYHSDICKWCVQRDKYVSDETKQRNSEAMKRRPTPPDYMVRSIDDAETFRRFGYHAYDLSPNSGKTVVGVCVECGKSRVIHKNCYRDLCRECTTKSDIYRHRLSAGCQGISYDDWDGYAIATPYCAKFNESCREHNRDKYGRACFICGKEETENGRKLSVHHRDMSKTQGCDGEKWKLVPLCNSCHSRAHNQLCQARIEYLLKYAHI